MPYFLNIETSTEVCSVSLTHGDIPLFVREDIDGPSHTTLLGGFIESALSYADEHSIKIDAVGISCGPGSYTGLRIGVSMAKGICFGLSVPLISVNTLDLMAHSVRSIIDDGYICPMIDARRMEVYTAIYDTTCKQEENVAAIIIDAESFQKYWISKPFYIFGNGAQKCLGQLTHPHIHFIESIYPSAAQMGTLIEAKYIKGQFEDLAYFEPFYLKEFITTKPKNLLS